MGENLKITATKVTKTAIATNGDDIIFLTTIGNFVKTLKVYVFSTENEKTQSELEIKKMAK